ncbi:hypothetical protein EP342_04975 [bacterium]|nr:MAG: hypothetical protein EP342_04975 [bacterium]
MKVPKFMVGQEVFYVFNKDHIVLCKITMVYYENQKVMFRLKVKHEEITSTIISEEFGLFGSFEDAFNKLIQNN